MIIKPKNAINVQDFDRNSEPPTNEPAQLITPGKINSEAKNNSEKAAKTEAKPQVPTLNLSDKKEGKRAGWGAKATPVLGEDPNRANVAPFPGKVDTRPTEAAHQKPTIA